MSSLTRLHVRASTGFTDDGMMQLTTLTGLHELGLRHNTHMWYTICSVSIMGSRGWTLKVSYTDCVVLLDEVQSTLHGHLCHDGILANSKPHKGLHTAHCCLSHP
jgi:hypothetical protein